MILKRLSALRECVSAEIQNITIEEELIVQLERIQSNTERARTELERHRKLHAAYVAEYQNLTAALRTLPLETEEEPGSLRRRGPILRIVSRNHAPAPVMRDMSCLRVMK